ncbi:MAG: hypothetical protein EXQ71_02360 [Acidimicrobiia bacterium]|nr:hypothetical protein [Acidimicrobiia bacterium]
MTFARRLCLFVTVVVGASGGLGVASSGAMAGAASSGACLEASGITVVVDFGSAGGGVHIRCAAAPVRSGFEALSKAGFDITNVRSQPGFLCQIEAKPVSECQAVPSASRYWSYWHAERGAAWIYSTSGGARRPPEGSVEGWSFGAGDPPGVAVPGPVSTPVVGPSTTTPAPRSAASVSDPPASVGAAPRSAAPVPAVATDELAVPAAAAPESALDAADLGTDAPAADPEELSANGVSATTPEVGAGSPVGVIAAALVVAGLAALGWRTAHRRTHGGPEEG